MRASLAAILVGFCAAGGAAEAAPLQVDAAALTASASEGRLQLVSALELTSPDPAFGGLSGAALDGSDRLLIVGDAGDLFTVTLIRDGAGRIVDVAGDAIVELKDAAGRPARAFSADAEALARGPSGALWVGYERQHRIAAHFEATGRVMLELNPPETAELSFNGGFEALAATPDGALLVFLEAPPPDAPETIRGYRYVGDSPTPFRLSRSDRFAPTGADIGPDGALYLLERRYDWWRGVAMRLRRFSAARVAEADWGAGDALATWSVLDAPIDNMEALVVAERPEGGLELLALSDDNFSWRQRTVLLQLRLD